MHWATGGYTKTQNAMVRVVASLCKHSCIEYGYTVYY